MYTDLGFGGFEMRNSDGWAIPIILVVAVLFVLGFARGAFVDESRAVKALETQGYSNVTITDHAWLLIGFRGCDAKDAAMFKTRATNPIGREVEVLVCTGWLFKGATIRTK